MNTIKSKFQDFKQGFIQGLGWSFGATVGFVIISTFLILILRAMGGLPLIGRWIASIVEATQLQLLNRNPLIH